MDIHVTYHNKVTIITCNGSLDALSTPEFIQQLEQLVSDGQVKLVIDFAGIDYVGSAGVRGLLKLTKDTRAHQGDVRLAAVSSDANKVFEMTGITGIVKSYASVEDALQGF